MSCTQILLDLSEVVTLGAANRRATVIRSALVRVQGMKLHLSVEAVGHVPASSVRLRGVPDRQLECLHWAGSGRASQDGFGTIRSPFCLGRKRTPFRRARFIASAERQRGRLHGSVQPRHRQTWTGATAPSLPTGWPAAGLVSSDACAPSAMVWSAASLPGEACATQGINGQSMRPACLP